MPILDLQKKMAETGRIRMGEKRVSQKSGKEYPAKLDTFRLTSKHRHVVDDAAAIYGGTVEPFNGNGWAVTTTAKTLEVIVPPGNMSFSQWREMWGKGHCVRRCDGETELNSDGPCQCPADPAERAALASKGKACKDTTRLSVMLPELTGVGLWRLDSHGYYAATELAGTIDIIQGLAPGMLVRGQLKAEEREGYIWVGGEPQSTTYIVPVLDLADVRLSKLMAPSGDGVSVAIQTRSSGLTAVPELPEGPRLTVAEQLATERPEPARRSNAAAELPATGLRPRPAGGPSPEDDAEPAEVEIVDDSQDLPDGWQKRNAKLQAQVHDLWKGETEAEIDRRRKALISMASDSSETSSKKLTDDEWSDLFTVMEDLVAGRTEVHLRATGEYDIRPIVGARRPNPDRELSGLELPGSADEWRDLIARAPVRQTDVLREAQRLAGSGGPGSLAALVGHEVAPDVLAWLQQQAAA